ncbi:MAG: hypothetical protein LBB65_05785 [Burkholderiales bacterium]|jgi:hypothetical protein|nr:hypothetical protein [Burkholderiales bacterium]
MSTPESHHHQHHQPHNRSHIQPIIRCSAGRGWLWWVEVFRLIKEAPGAWYRIGAGYFGIVLVILLPFMIVSIISKIDWVNHIGNLLFYVLAPIFTVGFVAAAWTQVRGGAPKLSHLFSGFKADVKTLMGVGWTGAALFILSVLIFFVLLGSDFVTQWQSFAKVNPGNADDPASAQAALDFLSMLVSPRLWLAILVFLTLASMIWMAIWLAPMVVVFQRTGVVKAMQRSFMGVWINWRALSIWILSYFGVAFVAEIVLLIVIVPLFMLMAMGGAVGTTIAVILLLMLCALIVPFLCCLMPLAAFVAYCDIFHAKDAVFPRPAKKKTISAP